MVQVPAADPHQRSPQLCHTAGPQTHSSGAPAGVVRPVPVQPLNRGAHRVLRSRARLRTGVYLHASPYLVIFW